LPLTTLKDGRPAIRRSVLLHTFTKNYRLQTNWGIVRDDRSRTRVGFSAVRALLP